MGRQGAYDGRGNLSQRTLVAWCEFFIDTCLDQVTFMTQMLEPQTLEDRLTALVKVRSVTNKDYRDELIPPLLHVMGLKPVSRGVFIQMTGLGTSTARRCMSTLLKDGLLKSPNHKAEVSIGLPLDALQILMPNLYPEASTAPKA